MQRRSSNINHFSHPRTHSRSAIWIIKSIWWIKMTHSCFAKGDQRAQTRLWSKPRARVRWRSIMITTVSPSGRWWMKRGRKCLKLLKKSIRALAWYQAARIKTQTASLTGSLGHSHQQELASIWMHLLLQFKQALQPLQIQAAWNWTKKGPHMTKEPPLRILSIFSQRSSIAMSIYLHNTSNSSQMTVEIPKMAEANSNQASLIRSN